jgi:peptidoglycan/xylan/chitin deacetylase (PgdA/CDA1 family)
MLPVVTIPLVRRLVYAGARLLGANRGARALFRSRLLVVCFHGVCGPRPDVPDPEGMHVPAVLFEDQVRFLARQYHPVALAEVRSHFLEGAPLPHRSVLVTFDDGYRNVVRNALPVLRRHGVACVLFPVPGAIDRAGWLWPSELEWRRDGDPGLAALKRRLKAAPARERRQVLEAEFASSVTYPDCDNSLVDWATLRTLAADDLVAIGSHGLSHEPLTTCEQSEVRSELVDSRRRLEEELGVEVDALAYPNGSASTAVAAEARASGYRLGFTTGPRHAAADDDALLVPRILVGAADRPSVLGARLAGWQEWIRR